MPKNLIFVRLTRLDTNGTSEATPLLSSVFSKSAEYGPLIGTFYRFSTDAETGCIFMNVGYYGLPSTSTPGVPVYSGRTLMLRLEFIKSANTAFLALLRSIDDELESRSKSSSESSAFDTA